MLDQLLILLQVLLGSGMHLRRAMSPILRLEIFLAVQIVLRRLSRNCHF